MKRKLALTVAISCLGLLYSENSSAQLFRLTVTDYNGTDSNATLKSLIDSQILSAQNEINKDLPSAQPTRLMEGMANSSVMAGKGIGTDYASGMDVFLIGAGVGVGADLHKDPTTKSDISGVGAAPGLVIGKNLGFMDTQKILGLETNKLNIFFNFMSYGLNKTINDEPNKEQKAELGMMAFGTHLRYDWIAPRGSKWLGWGGVKVTFGYEYNKTRIKFKSQISEDINETSSVGDLSGTITGNPEAQIDIATHSIPLAISTDVRLLYFLSLYSGLGLDFNFGQAKGKGNLNSDESQIHCTGGTVCSTPQDISVKADANIDATGKVNGTLFRGFAGVQINLPFTRVFVQVDKALGNDLIGATAGLRFVY